MIFNGDKLKFYGVIKPYPTVSETVSMAEAALKGGLTCLQLRYKEDEHEIQGNIADYALALASLCRQYQALFIINDDVKLAYEVNADGVHIGQGDMNIVEARNILGHGRIIGVTVHNGLQAMSANKHGADYLGVGAIFPTATKLDADVTNQETVKEICCKGGLPVVAIGGISLENIHEFKQYPLSLCQGIAVVSALFGSDSSSLSPDGVLENARKLNHQLKMLFPKAVALTIAGSDCSGGAGIQADLKSFAAMGVYGESVITALTAQNTTGVFDVMNCSDSIVDGQLQAVLSDIPPQAIKIGMVSSTSIIKVISRHLKDLSVPIVVDPVMVSTSGHKLISDDAISVLKQELFPMASLLTPNIPEAQVLSNMEIINSDNMITAAEIIYKQFNCPVLCKGGHLVSDACDLLYDGKTHRWFNGRRIDTANTHGTGCSLSSAIAACLAKSMPLPSSIVLSKAFLSHAMDQGLDLGDGHGPLDHNYMMNLSHWSV